MATQRIDMEGGGTVEVEVAPATKGKGVKVDKRLKPPIGPESTHVTCTCYDGGQAYTATKDCPNGNNTCDCSSPRRPSITCG